MSVTAAGLLSLVPIFKDSIGKVIEAGAEVVKGYGDLVRSYGRCAENISSGIGDRIRGGPAPVPIPVRDKLDR